MPALMIFMGKLTDTFINYEFFKTIADFANGTYVYDTQLISITNKTEFFNTIQRLIQNYSSDINLNTIQIRLKLDFDEFVDELNDTFRGIDGYKTRFIDESNNWSILMCAVGVASIICGYIMVATFSSAANNQAHRIRVLFFGSTLKQDITWYDTKTSGDFATKVTA